MVTPQAQLPTPERLPAWRAACLAYREHRRAGAGDAVVALQAVWPLPDKEAGQEATNAIAYASTYPRNGSGRAGVLCAPREGTRRY